MKHSRQNFLIVNFPENKNQFSIIWILVLIFIIPISVFAQTLPTKTEVINKMKLVNEYWMKQNPTPGNNQWARAAYFTGNMNFFKVYPKETYLRYTELWASNNSWSLNGGNTTRVADNQIAGQVYIDLYNLDSIKQYSKIDAIQSSIQNMVINSKSDDWWWVDALYMAMPVFTRLGVLNNDSTYFNRMYDIYYNTKVTRGLFNETDGLWYRDESFDPPYFTPNGEKSYWARGNGWAIAAHLRVLQLLPIKNSHRAEFIDTFLKMAAALKTRQREDGFWNCSLNDPNDFGGPETSGTAFFTYGLAWGINNNLLDSATYFPIVAKAWNALSTIAVQTNGFLGYVQGVGSNPSSSQPVTANSTADFGVGAFLLAGTEILKLSKGEMPVPANFFINKAIAIDNEHIKLVFNKPVDFSTAQSVFNYNIDNNINILSAANDVNDSCVILNVSTLGYGKYNLQVSNVKSKNEESIENGESIAFTYSGIYSVTSSSYESGTSNTADKTIDFDFSTRWSALGSGEWILYDLGELKTVKSVDLAFYNGNTRKGYFSINISEDGSTFSEVYNGESSGTTLDLENYDFSDQEARYVKIIGFGNSQSSWNSITETRINAENISSVSHSVFNDTEFNLYPNPLTGNELHIQTNIAFSKIAISDLSGKTIYQTKSNISKLYDLNLENGIYFLTAYFPGKSPVCKLFLVE